MTGALSDPRLWSGPLHGGWLSARSRVSGTWLRGYRYRAVGIDLLAGMSAAIGASWFRFDGYPSATYLLLAGITPFLWVLTVAFADGYNHRILGSGTMEYRAIWSRCSGSPPAPPSCPM